LNRSCSTCKNALDIVTAIYAEFLRSIFDNCFTFWTYCLRSHRGRYGSGCRRRLCDRRSRQHRLNIVAAFDAKFVSLIFNRRSAFRADRSGGRRRRNRRNRSNLPRSTGCGENTLDIVSTLNTEFLVGTIDRHRAFWTNGFGWSRRRNGYWLSHGLGSTGCGENTLDIVSTLYAEFLVGTIDRRRAFWTNGSGWSRRRNGYWLSHGLGSTGCCKNTLDIVSTLYAEFLIGTIDRCSTFWTGWAFR
jgi:hypothetical protein